MKKLLAAFVEDKEGLTMVESAAAGALVTSAPIVGFTNLGAAVVARITFIAMATNTQIMGPHQTAHSSLYA